MTQRLALLVVLVSSATLASIAPFAANRPDDAAVSVRSPAAPQVTIDYVGRPGYTEEIFFAVLEGLYRDGVANVVVDAIVAEEPASGYPANFVYACPICMPALRAFHVYRARPTFYRDKEQRDSFGEGLDAATNAKLVSLDATERQGAIAVLIERWIGERMALKRLTADERAEWLDEIALRRKEGMSYLQAYRRAGVAVNSGMNACAFCDGAQAACKRPR